MSSRLRIAGTIDASMEHPILPILSDLSVAKCNQISFSFLYLEEITNRTRRGVRPGGRTDALEERWAPEAIIRWINRTYDNSRTTCDYRIAIRALGKHALRLAPKEDPPESGAWMSANTPRNYDSKPSRADMLDWQEDIVLLINSGTTNARNKALFAVQFESGFRPHCELYELRVGGVKRTLVL